MPLSRKNFPGREIKQFKDLPRLFKQQRGSLLHRCIVRKEHQTDVKRSRNTTPNAPRSNAGKYPRENASGEFLARQMMGHL